MQVHTLQYAHPMDYAACNLSRSTPQKLCPRSLSTLCHLQRGRGFSFFRNVRWKCVIIILVRSIWQVIYYFWACLKESRDFPGVTLAELKKVKILDQRVDGGRRGREIVIIVILHTGPIVQEKCKSLLPLPSLYAKAYSLASWTEVYARGAEKDGRNASRTTITYVMISHTLFIIIIISCSL